MLFRSGVAEAMDTAQRGMGLDWPTSLELIRRSVREARSVPGAVVYSGAGTDHLPPGAIVSIDDARDVWLMATRAYVAAGRNGIAIVDVDSPEHPSSLRWFNADGCINDATGIVTALEGNSFFAFVADGCNGLKVIQLLSPADGSRIKGFSPEIGRAHV